METELKILSTVKAQDFRVEKVYGTGQYGIVFKARCVAPGLPPPAIYALKVMFNYGVLRNDLHSTFRNEFELLPQLRSPYIIQYLGQFHGAPTDEMLQHFPDFAKEAAVVMDKGVASKLHFQFVLLRCCEQNLESLVNRVSVHQFLPLAWGILSGVQYLASQGVVHRDLKLDNVLLSPWGDPVIADFGYAVRLPEAMRLKYDPDTAIGGNQAHLSPEVLSVHSRATKKKPKISKSEYVLDYSQADCWAVGVMFYELVLGGHPCPQYPGKYADDEGGVWFDTELLPSFPDDFPADVARMVRGMTHPDPARRTTCAEALKVVEAHFRQSSPELLKFLEDVGFSSHFPAMVARGVQIDTLKQVAREPAQFQAFVAGLGMDSFESGILYNKLQPLLVGMGSVGSGGSGGSKGGQGGGDAPPDYPGSGGGSGPGPSASLTSPEQKQAFLDRVLSTVKSLSGGSPQTRQASCLWIRDACWSFPWVGDGIRKDGSAVETIVKLLDTPELIPCGCKLLLVIARGLGGGVHKQLTLAQRKTICSALGKVLNSKAGATPQPWHCSVLSLLALVCSEEEEVIEVGWKAGVLPPIISLLRTVIPEDLLLQACATLYCLSAFPSAKAAIEKGGTVQALGAIRERPDSLGDISRSLIHRVTTRDVVWCQ